MIPYTHTAKALTAAGFEAQQAEATTDTTREAFTESVAIKADVAEVKAELKANIANLETQMAERFEALYKQLWLVALGIVTAVAAIVKLL